MADEIESPLDNKDKRRQPMALQVRCKQCIFFKDRAHQSFKHPCSDLGVKQYSKPCQKFFANPYYFVKDDPEFKLLKKLLFKYKKQLPALVGWLNQELATKKVGYSFGQTVYVRMVGEDYLLNYAKATVVSANKEHVYIQSRKVPRGTYLHSSIFTEEQWKRKKRNLIKHKRIRDPKEKEYYKIKKVPKPIDYEVPTIDEFEKVYQRKAEKATVYRVNKSGK